MSVRGGLAGKRWMRLLPLLLLLAVVAAATTGSAACNVVPPSRAGDGEGTVSGYTVSDVAFEVSPADPGTIVGVRFSLDAPAGEVTASLDGGATWAPCAPVGPLAYDCAPLSVPVTLVTSLRVVAAE